PAATETPRPPAMETPRAGSMPGDPPRFTAPPRPAGGPEPAPLPLVYGREITLPGDKPEATTDEPKTDRIEVEPGPSFTPPVTPPAAPAKTPPRPTPMPHAPTPVAGKETVVEATADGVVVPLRLVAGDSSEIVLKIILKLDKAA